MFGVKNTLLIRLQFPDLASSLTYDTAVANMEEVRQQFVRASYKNIDLNVTVTTDALMLPYDSTYYKTTGGGATFRDYMCKDAIAAANRAGYAISVDDWGTYNRVVLHYPNIGRANYYDNRFGVVYMNGTLRPRYVLHEMGHAMWFGHSGIWKVTDGNPASVDGKADKYGDPFDFMGWISGDHKKLDYNPYHKYWAGWIREDQVTKATSSDYTYEIRRFDHIDANVGTGVQLAIKVQIDDKHSYWIGYRRNFAADTGLIATSAHGAYIVRATNDNWDASTALIDTQTPGSEARDAVLPIGTTLYAEGGITITPTEEGGIEPNTWLKVRISQ